MPSIEEQRIGLYNNSGVYYPDGLTWKFNIEIRIRVSPVVINQVVYVINDKGTFYAIDTRTRKAKWNCQTSEVAKWFETALYRRFPPTIVDNIGYISNNNQLYGIDLKTGRAKWTFTTPGAVESSPVVADGVVYIASNFTETHWPKTEHPSTPTMDVYGYLQAVDIATQQVIWQFEKPNGVSSLAVADGTVYIFAFGSFWALDSASSAVRWQFNKHNHSFLAPVVVNGIVYVSCPSYYFHTKSSVVALQSANGKVMWEFQTNSYISTSPLVTDDMVYVSTRDGYLLALNKETGQLQWNFYRGDRNITSPSIAEGIVYFSSEDGNLYALSSTTGQQLWKFTTRGAGFSSPAVAAGMVYFGSEDGCLYAIDTKTALINQIVSSALIPIEPVPEPPINSDGAMYRANPQQTGVYITRGVHQVVGLKWKLSLDTYLSSPPIVANGIVYVGGSNSHLYAIDAEVGKQIWQFKATSGIHSSAAIADGMVYIGSDSLYALSATTGQEQWSIKLRSASSAAVVNGTIYVYSRNKGGSDNLSALSCRNGQLKWSSQNVFRRGACPLIDDGIVLVRNYQVEALSLATGEVAWQFKTQQNDDILSAISDGTVYMCNGQKNFYAADISTGEVKWNFSPEKTWLLPTPAIFDDTVYTIGENTHTLYALSCTTGEEKWQFTTDTKIQTPPTIADGIVYLGTFRGHIYAVDTQTGRQLWKWEIGTSLYSELAIASGVIYTTGYDGKLYALS
ncbi:MAG: PQQ-binding-like beta-propeller repeat protein [Aulosira sp. ZfuVER01]|nr:PQQ-binding-like beta-propeller repeat protein [Aulosira sp. ZfuVER01]MDZ8001793.1 PQQ-binding-like beta-propeller repeat protein [Aulosira sp. DedVER01a]MDZ8053268.1 PQQ-binding-like beta-propeller repeat protein [Aulosira sp. ZfuCHP01]